MTDTRHLPGMWFADITRPLTPGELDVVRRLNTQPGMDRPWGTVARDYIDLLIATVEARDTRVRELEAQLADAQHENDLLWAFVRDYDATSPVIRSDDSTAEDGVKVRQRIDTARALLPSPPAIAAARATEPPDVEPTEILAQVYFDTIEHPLPGDRDITAARATEGDSE